MKGIAKLGLVLAIFAAAACASLAVVYSITKPQIEAQDQIALTASLKEIFPDAVNFEDVTDKLVSKDTNIKFLNAVLVKGENAPIGVAVKAAGPSYGGQATLLVGVTLQRSIAGVRILELKDTPGLGANANNPGYFVKKAEKVTFPGQFTGKYLTDAFAVKDDVIAITASTITSKSLTKIIKTAGDSAAEWLESVATNTSAETTGGK